MKELEFREGKASHSVIHADELGEQHLVVYIHTNIKEVRYARFEATRNSDKEVVCRCSEGYIGNTAEDFEALVNEPYIKILKVFEVFNDSQYT